MLDFPQKKIKKHKPKLSTKKRKEKKRKVNLPRKKKWVHTKSKNWGDKGRLNGETETKTCGLWSDEKRKLLHVKDEKWMREIVFLW